jgi:hypothetical protein
MKNILSYLLLIGVQATFAQAIWDGTVDTDWYSDSEMEVFTITTAEQLAGLAELVNSGTNFKNKTINLGANIMLNDTTDWQDWENNPPENTWTPIGYGNAIVGTFDGNGHVISGVYINNSSNSQGLFGTVGYFGGGIKNLGVTASYIKSEGSDVGGLLGNNNYGKIDSCYFTGIVIGTLSVGGLVGSNGLSIRNSYFTGTVIGKNNIGGLVGSNWAGTVWDSYSTGMVMGESSIGGLAGSNGKSISNSYSTSNVIGTESSIGGLVGRNANLSTINSSYSTGSVEGKDNVGGLVGSNGSDDKDLSNYWGKINNSYSTSTVKGEASVGGLVGANNNTGQIKCSYSIGLVTGESDIGGLVGKRIGNNPIDGSYYDMQTNGQSGDFGKITVQMKRIATYIDWDFNDIWGRRDDTNDGYPYLRWGTTLTNDGDAPLTAEESCEAEGNTWENEKCETTPIRLPQIAIGNIRAWAINSNIILENLSSNARVDVYSLNGKRIYTVRASFKSAQTIIPVSTKGIYIVKVGTKMFRIMIK